MFYYKRTLLETTKPYLTGTLRMPGAQTLLLFANSIDTNSDFTRYCAQFSETLNLDSFVFQNRL
jgi:hypothetical protein